MPRSHSFAWFKLDSKGWLDGSIRIQMTPDQRSVWADLLALANECRLRDGTLRFAEGLPMDRQWIADRLKISIELLNETIDVCVNDKNRNDNKHRIEIWNDGTIQIVNWEQYQEVPAERKALTERERELIDRTKLNKLGAMYPREAANIPEVKEILEEVDEKDN